MARAENEDEQNQPENFAVDTTFNIPLRHLYCMHLLWPSSGMCVHVKPSTEIVRCLL